MLFTTSWDDGHVLDRKLIDLLRKYKIRGTFYISKQHELVDERLSEREIHDLAHEMECGAHTLTHPDLTSVTPDNARKEIADSKVWMESITQKTCDLFCYPRGRFNDVIKSMTKECGFRGARTTELYRFTLQDPFAMPVSLHIYPFPFRPIANRRFYEPFSMARAKLGSAIPLSRYTSWLSFAKALFVHAYQTNQPFFHLFGHSWEIEKFGMWNHLEKFLSYVASKQDLQHVPNSSLFRP
jgi:peptidoglycan/xylan/chitin deacetylase (PgdA/CDA1 family)